METLSWLQGTDLATIVRENSFAFPIVEAIHVLAVGIVVGSIVVVDGHLIGALARNGSVRVLMARILPITWIAFAGAVFSGSVLFVSNAVDYYGNHAFRVKLALLVLAGGNAALFHWTLSRDERRISRTWITSYGRAAGALSLVLWVAITSYGRWIGFV